MLVPFAGAGTAGAAPAPRPGAPRSDATTESHTVTLVTGDVVRYVDGPGDRDTVTVDRPDGASGGVRIQQAGDDVYVLPDEATTLIAAGTLDRRLFNVSALVRMGYDDEGTGAIPVIATYPPARAKALPATPRGAQKVRTLASIHGAALSADKDGARTFWDAITRTPSARSLDSGIAKLWLDGRSEALLADSVPQVRAPEAWAAGFDGKGTKVAVLDTGIDADHPDVKDRLVGARSFVPGEEVDDKHGHGTHVASTIAGSGAGSDGANKGVAPAAALLVGKVLSDEGSGADSGIIEAMEWAKAEGADIVSMSLGSPVPDDGTDPMSQAVNSLSADGGPLFVIAAGNAYGAGTIGSPGSAEQALTVAAVDKRDGRGFADYLYDLVDRHDGTIPDRSLAFAPSTRRLAKVENTFYGHKKTLGAGYRYDIPDYGPGLGFEEYEQFPDVRTEWVNPLPGDSFWYENHSVLDAEESDRAHEMRSAELDYRAGKGYRAEWFAPVTRPRLGTGYWGPFRTVDNDLQFNITPWTDAGAGHSGSMPENEYDTTSYAFYQGDTQLKKGAGRAGYIGDLSAEKRPYRLVIDSARDAKTWKTSTRTRSEWGFVSGALDEAGPYRADIPLLQLDYAVDTDLAGDVRAGRTTEIGLTSGTQEWLPGAVKANKASLSVSYDDGKHWTKVDLRKKKTGEWTAKLRTPSKGATSVSLKAHAQGPGGLVVDQQIIRAFGLK
nr:S8 family serine peptidase [Streptomyces badius]